MQTLFSLENLHRQYLACRRGKRNTVNALRFEARQEHELLALREALASRIYQPGRSVCFFVKRPKLREVFAADFRDRVVHHVLVSHLEKTWERIFIHDSHACRKGRGVHAAVQRLQTFMRQASANGTREAWAMQLDVKNYFMSIDKQRLYEMVAAKLDARRPKDAEALWLAHALIFHDCTVGPHIKGDPRLIERLPPHKTLFHAPPGTGLPIGNLNSQFFANVYLNALDQFVKHELKCRWYLRYCDDFILLAHEPAQFLGWRERIAEFLAGRLALQLNPSRQRLCPVRDGVDFLGYIVRPTHLLVRQRVVGHLREMLDRHEALLVGADGGMQTLRYDAPAIDSLQASLASYLGHMRVAASYRLRAATLARHPWLNEFFRFDGAMLAMRRRDVPLRNTSSTLTQYAHWRCEFPADEIWMQVGAFVERLRWPPRGWRQRFQEPATIRPLGLRPMRPNRRGATFGFPIEQLARRRAAWLQVGTRVTFVTETLRADTGPVVRTPAWRCAPLPAKRAAMTCSCSRRR